MEESRSRALTPERNMNNKFILGEYEYLRDGQKVIWKFLVDVNFKRE